MGRYHNGVRLTYFGPKTRTPTVRRTYDSRDRLARKSDPDGLTIEYTYDAAGNLVSRVSPSQSLVYTYDARNRLETVTRTIDGAPAQVTRYAYDAAGNRREMQGADGTRTEYTYDARHRLASLVKRTAAGALLAGMAYTVDDSGLRTALTESDPAGTTRSVTYAYDALKRLTAETITHRDPARNRTSTWTYDRVGNRLTQTIHTAVGTVGAASAATVYTYDANDRLTSETTTVGAASAATMTYTYDANGNTLQKTTPSGPIEYAYDDANRLTEMRQASERTTYAYDADGLRIAQTRHPASGAPVTTRYLQDPSYAYSQVIEQWRKEGAGATTLEATYAFADDLIAQTRYAGVAATTSFVQADGFGSVRWLTDAAGGITDAVEYDAFGNEIGRSGTTPVEHRYRGEQFDPGLGFYYLRARWMDPGVGRFVLQDDWHGDRQRPLSLNKYLYGAGDPVNRIDPSGYLDLVQTSLTLNTHAILAMGARVVGAATGMFIGSRINNIVSSRAAARACAARYATGLRSFGAGDCSDVRMPIVFMSESKMPGIGEHVMKSMAQGSPAIVHRTFLLKLTNRLVATAKCRRGMSISIVNAGTSCDEYPFASTYEGGLGSTVAKVPWLSNLIQGGVLSGFYSACMVEPEVLPLNEFLVLPVANGPAGANFQCRYFGAR